MSDTNNQVPEGCTHDCNTCGASCASRQGGADPFTAPANKHSNVRKVIGVVSGKGGVGKSMVTSLLAVAARRQGLSAAILDADVTGPSIPKGFGLSGQVSALEDALLPAYTMDGIGVISVNLVLDNPNEPVIWRGPIIAGVVKQFWTDVAWGDVDAMFVDMPPGTGDVPLTVFQSLPLDGIIVVTTPQDLVGMVVEKAIRMAEKMNIPVLGIVENMSYFACPDCGKRVEIFGKSHADGTAEAHGIGNVLKLPVRPEMAALADEGRLEDSPADLIGDVAAFLNAVL